jgi:hypothetical protein
MGRVAAVFRYGVKSNGPLGSPGQAGGAHSSSYLLGQKNVQERLFVSKFMIVSEFKLFSSW